MIIITKGKNYCELRGDKGTLLFVRKLLNEPLTIINKNYAYVERNAFFINNTIKKLNAEKQDYRDIIDNLKFKLKNNTINSEQYKFEYENVHTNLKSLEFNLNKKVQSLTNVEKYLKFSKPEYNFYNINKDSNVDTFEIGFYPQIKHILKQNNITFKTHNVFSYPPLTVDKKLFNREYQLTAVQKILDKKIGIIKLPTGSGKTEIALAFINTILKYVLKRRRRIIFIIEQAELLLQTRDDNFYDNVKKQYRFVTPATIGLIGSGFKDWDNDIVIATVQTLNNMLTQEPKEFKDWAKTFDAYIIDECDNFTSDKRLKTLRYFNEAKWRLFLSATPFSRFKELERFKLTGISGGIIYTIKESELIKQGYLSQQSAVFIKNYSIENSNKQKQLKWLQAYEFLIVKSQHRNKLVFNIVELLKKFNLRALLIVERKEHGLLLSQKLELPLYSGADDIFERKAAIADIQSGKNKIIITTRIFRRAINIPELQIYFNLAGYKSDNIVAQGKGRIGRIKTKNENKALYIDFADYGNKYLEQHSQERILTLKEMAVNIEEMYVESFETYLKNYFNL